MDYRFCEVVLNIPTSATSMFWNGFVEKKETKNFLSNHRKFCGEKVEPSISCVFLCWDPPFHPRRKNIQKHETQLLWIQPINMLPGSFQSKSLIKAEKHQAHDIHWDGWFLFFTVANHRGFTILGGFQSSNPRCCCVTKNSFNFVGEFLTLNFFLQHFLGNRKIDSRKTWL